MSYSLTTDKTWSETMADLRTTFERWAYDTVGAYRMDWGVECPVSAARYGSRTLPKEDRSVRLAFVHPKTGREIVLEMNRQQRPVDNLRVLYLSVEAMRLNEKRGLGETIQAAYLQLAAPKSERDPFEVLGLRSDASPEDVDLMYKAKAKRLHPDAGGNEAAFKELQAAYEKVRKS